MKFTEEQKQAARYSIRAYERRIEMIWDDMEFDLEMRLGLDAEQVGELLDQAEQ